MKTLIINIISWLAQDQLKKLEDNQKMVGLSGTTVSVPHHVVLKLAIEDQKEMKKMFTQVNHQLAGDNL